MHLRCTNSPTSCITRSGTRETERWIIHFHSIAGSWPRYCKSIDGRLPSFDEWSYAAYQQVFNSSEFEKGKVYKYPSGDEAKNMNSQGLLNYDKHIDVTKLPEGINGLVAMGGNVWEWIDDQKNDNSLTAGASWWYGGSKTSKSGAQYKPSNFYAIYVGFRCAFD